jgi:DNA modification methylase
LAKIIRHQGWRSPIVVSKRSGFVVAGHGRLQAAQLLQVEKVPVDYQDFANEAEEYAHLVADNRIAELAEIDEKELAGLLKELDGKIDLDLTGFDAGGLSELGGLLGGSEVDAEPQIDKAAELQKEWKTVRGQIWELGEHRLMCGSSTDCSEFHKLVDGKLSLVWTDPPYGVSYGAKNGFLNAISPGNRIQKPIENDQLSEEDTGELFAQAMTLAHKVGNPGCVCYAAVPPGPLLPHFISAFSESGFQYKHLLVWVKNQFVLGRSDYHYRHEPILYGWKGGAHYFIDDSGKDTVFEFDKPRQSDLHPTMKPVELVAAMVGNSSRVGDLVYEPFSGSGTTIIACERLGRRCRAMEISPGYVAVALQRYKDATGKTPKLINA